MSDDFGRFTAGRDKIYEFALYSISNNLFFGNYIGYIHRISSSSHNIFLEILCDYGLIVFCAFVCFLVYRIYVFIKYGCLEEIPILIIFVSCAFEQMTSGYMFFQNNFMFLLGLLMANRYKKLYTN